MNRSIIALLISLFFVLLNSSTLAADNFDILLLGGTVVDGTGAPRYVADIAIRDGKIAAVGKLSEAEARRTISAEGLIVAPGFIDMMGRSATPMLDDPRTAMNLLARGVTTIKAGHGRSAAPLSDAAAKRSRWQTMAEYFQILDMKGLPVNVVQTVGHTQVRRIVLGDSDRRPSGADMHQMEALVREAMEAGAIGLSTAPIHPPAVDADAHEIGALAAVAGRYGGRYYTHIRNEGELLLEAADEALEIGRVGNVPVHIFSLNATGNPNWPRIQQGALSLEQAVAQAAAAAAESILRDDRGRIADGLAADLIVFDYENLPGRATIAEPGKPADWIQYVLVGGRVVLDEAKLTDARPGRVLRGPGYDPCRAPSALSTGKSDPRMASFDRMMTAFIQRHHVPGAALAVTDRRRLVHARGYGYADIAAGEKVDPTSLFRIASISKPVTAVAVLQLVEQGRLSLDDKVFDLLHWSALAADDDHFDSLLESVTVRHLLQHRGGWDRSQSFDAMFQSVRFAQMQKDPPPADPDAIIRSMFTQRLDFSPGQRYAYSNYGYCLLGRIIETVAGEPYDDYVTDHVLLPLAVKSMTLGHTRLDDRQKHEVRYYDPNEGPSVFARDLNRPVAQPYGAWCLESMDAHGGWIASAVDLARFACAFDEPEQCKVLHAETVHTMHARPLEELVGDSGGELRPVYYSCGWQNRVVGEDRFNRWHNGSLPGTSALLVRRHDGRNWVLLLNARVSPHTAQLHREADPLLHRAADEVADWPEYDLFDDFQ